MAARWERILERWTGAGLIDAATAERIRAYEAEQEKALGLRWPVLLTIIFGVILVGGGVLLFVAAHWDELSPAGRFTLVLLLVALFHVAGALLADRFAVLATALHALGTIALGAGIYLAAQIFNLQEHWPGGLMLWALGAWVGWGCRPSDWVQATLAALFTPAWLASEWTVTTERMHGGKLILAQGLFLLAIVYLTARTRERDNLLRRALATTGGVAIIPCTIFLFMAMDRQQFIWGPGVDLPRLYLALGYVLAIGLPIAVGYVVRGRAAWMTGVAAFWVVVVAALDLGKKDQSLLIFLWCAVGGAALAAWGIYDERYENERLGLAGLFASVCALLFWAQRYESIPLYPLCAAIAVGEAAWGVKAARKEGINFGVATFAVVVGFFYFSTVMDKLGRSASLIGLGALFLLGGWALERTRRSLIARLSAGEK